MKKLYTVSESAEVLNISERTVWNLIKKGSLSTVRVGDKTVRVSLNAIDSFISASETRPDNLVQTRPLLDEKLV